MAVSRFRHVAKAISWRIIGTLDTFILAWIVTGNISISAIIGGFEVITKTILYYYHERLWYNYIKIGLKEKE